VRATLAPLLGLILAASVEASVARRASVEELAETSAGVVDGTVIDHVATLDRAAGGIWTTWRVRVGRTFIGDASGEIAVRVRGGQVGTLVQETIGAPRLVDGERVVLFLGPAAGGAREVIGLAQGVFRVETDARTGATTCRNSLEGLELVDETGTTSAAPLKLSLDDLAARVAAGRERLEARRRAASEAMDRRLAAWRREALRHAELTRGRPGGAPDR
jgi:hypothetical protein